MTEETLEVRAYQDYLRQRLRRNRSKAGQGDAGAMYDLGRMYDNEQDHVEAAHWYRLAAEQALAMLATNREQEEPVVEENRSKAEQGDAQAQFLLGRMYRFGNGVAQDDVEAERLFRLSAEQGHARAQNYLGFMYSNGEGVARDDEEAKRWYRLADEQEEAQ